jgi:hypothetical protein
MAFSGNVERAYVRVDLLPEICECMQFLRP